MYVLILPNKHQFDQSISEFSLLTEYSEYNTQLHSSSSSFKVKTTSVVYSYWRSAVQELSTGETFYSVYELNLGETFYSVYELNWGETLQSF